MWNAGRRVSRPRRACERALAGARAGAGRRVERSHRRGPVARRRRLAARQPGRPSARLIARAALAREESRGAHCADGLPGAGTIYTGCDTAYATRPVALVKRRTSNVKLRTSAPNFAAPNSVAEVPCPIRKKTRSSPRSRRAPRISRAGISTSSAAPSWPTTRRSRAAWSSVRTATRSGSTSSGCSTRGSRRPGT